MGVISYQDLVVCIQIYFSVGLVYLGLEQLFDKNSNKSSIAVAYITLWWVFLLARVFVMLVELGIKVLNFIFKRQKGE